MQRYQIETINLGPFSKLEELHAEFARKLNFPSSYDNTWESFWDLICGPAKVDPYLILYGWLEMDERFPNDRERLAAIRWTYNEKLRKEVIFGDELTGLVFGEKLDSVSCIFSNMPMQRGLRGDKYLWRDLEEHFQHLGIPRDEDHLVELLFEMLEKLTGRPVTEESIFYVDKYKHGGMSSGGIYGPFWVNKAIPLLVGRFQMLKKSWPQKWIKNTGE